MTSATHLPQASSRCLLLLSLLAFCIDVSVAATIQLGQPLTSTTTALNATEGHYYCSRQEEFLTDAFEGKDCLVAIEKLRRIEETVHHMHPYEFRELPSHHEHPFETQKMPRKYVSGMCRRSSLERAYEFWLAEVQNKAPAWSNL